MANDEAVGGFGNGKAHAEAALGERSERQITNRT
jgi:hypothetical protein